MNKISKLLVILCFGFLSSCAIHNGYMNNSVALTEANFNYKEISVSGTSSTTHVLGIGGLSEAAIVEAAKKDLINKHDLKANQALANITVNWKNGFYFLVITKKCTVTADIVEFTK